MTKKERVKQQKRFDNIKNTVRRLEGILEIFLLSFLYYTIWKEYYRSCAINKYYGNGKYLLIGIYAVLIIVVFINCECFKYGHLKISDIMISQGIGCIVINFITYLQLCLLSNKMLSGLPMILLFALDLLVVFCCVWFYTMIYHKMCVPRHMLMICGNKKALTLKTKMDTRSDKYRIAKIITIDKDFESICKEIDDYDAVIINDVSAKMRNDLLKYCYMNRIRTYVTPKLSDIILAGGNSITLFDTPLILVKGYGLSLSERITKRVFDIVLCLIAMVPGIPIMLITAIAIKLEDGGPVFFKQRRVTKDGREFDILKFRSMIVDADKAGVVPTVEKDPRITKVGSVIRGPRIDELPQLLNILKGDMSIVGPRPERVEHVEKYTKEIPEFQYRSKVKGGLTGVAQIYGKYNTTAYDKIRLDLMYIENYSLMLDIKLILMTLRVLLKKDSTEGFDKQLDEDKLIDLVDKDLIGMNKRKK